MQPPQLNVSEVLSKKKQSSSYLENIGEKL